MFSGIVKIADIDDYITPSQNCIKPISEAPAKNNPVKAGKKKLVINSINEESEFSQIVTSESKKAKITLNDCLACSGCVTTAETLLIQEQSIDELIKNSKRSKVSICLISPQSIASLANFFEITEENAMEKLCKIFEDLGFNFVFNYNTILNYTLEKNYEEFKEKVLREKQEYLINSECPGWICYAEKKIGKWIIPFLSNIKSPQQIFGNLIKRLFGKFFAYEDIFIASIMPCFDKKLEATRSENYFTDKDLEIKEVDTVISTIELLDLFDKLKIDLSKYTFDSEQKIFYTFERFFNLYDNILINNEESLKEKENLNKLLLDNYDNKSTSIISNVFETDINFSSNGYVEYIIDNLIKEEKVKDQNVKVEIERKTLKNSDFKEIELKIKNESDEEKVFKFALIYGFRNIQNFLRNKKKMKYHYLEVMACPGGCINGGN